MTLASPRGLTLLAFLALHQGCAEGALLTSERKPTCEDECEVGKCAHCTGAGGGCANDRGGACTVKNEAFGQRGANKRAVRCICRKPAPPAEAPSTTASPFAFLDPLTGLTETGYANAAEKGTMRDFVREVIEKKLGGTVANEGDLSGFAEWYDGKTHGGKRSLAAMEEELRSKRPEWIKWPGAEGAPPTAPTEADVEEPPPTAPMAPPPKIADDLFAVDARPEPTEPEEVFCRHECIVNNGVCTQKHNGGIAALCARCDASGVGNWEGCNLGADLWGAVALLPAASKEAILAQLKGK